MSKRIWFYLSIIQSLILVCILVTCLSSSSSNPNIHKTNLKEYLELYSPDNNYSPDIGYIPDAKTAKIVGSQIIDKLTGNSRFCPNGMTIDYDEANRLWRIEKGYLFSNGGYIIIEQDSGKIIKALLTK